MSCFDQERSCQSASVGTQTDDAREGLLTTAGPYAQQQRQLQQQRNRDRRERNKRTKARRLAQGGEGQVVTDVAHSVQPPERKAKQLLLQTILKGPRQGPLIYSPDLLEIGAGFGREGCYCAIAAGTVATAGLGPMDAFRAHDCKGSPLQRSASPFYGGGGAECLGLRDRQSPPKAKVHVVQVPFTASYAPLYALRAHSGISYEQT